MNHPLTDKMIWEMAGTWRESSYCDGCRAAYDKGGEDMLEQVTKWLKATKSTVKICPSILADQIEQAMRPQEEN